MIQNETSTRGRHEVLTIQDGEDMAQNEARGRYEVLTIQDGEDVTQNETSTRGRHEVQGHVGIGQVDSEGGLPLWLVVL